MRRRAFTTVLTTFLTTFLAAALAISASGCSKNEFTQLFGWPPDLAPRAERADKLVVRKAQRRLELYRSNKLLAAFQVELGFAPSGARRRRGDGKTPEGAYRIVHRNADSKFHLSLAINYPNAADKERAAAQGVKPGGGIVIHGGSGLFDHAKGELRGDDWTEGCIALTNEEMEWVWARVATGTPIEIQP